MSEINPLTNLELAKLQYQAVSRVRNLLSHTLTDKDRAKLVDAVDQFDSLAYAHLAHCYEHLDTYLKYTKTKKEKEQAQAEAEALKVELVSQRFEMFRFNFRSVEYRPQDGLDTPNYLEKAVYTAALTIDLMHEAIGLLGFVCQQRNSNGHTAYYAKRTDEYYQTLMDHFWKRLHYAWQALMLFSGLAGGHLATRAVLDAAKDMTNSGEDLSKYSKVGVMQFLQVGHDSPSRVECAEEDAFQDAIRTAINNLRMKG